MFVQPIYFLTLIPPLTYFFVNYNLLGSRFRTRAFFLHLAEQNHITVPSFFANIVPDPFDTERLQKLQNLANKLIIIYLIFLASRSVSLNIKISDIRTVPFTFLVSILP